MAQPPPPYVQQVQPPPPYVQQALQPPAYPTAGYYVPTPAAAAQAGPQPTPKPVVHEEPKKEKKGGFFSNLKKEAEKAGKSLSKELDKAGKSINETVDQNYQSALLDMFKNGNVVQLVSRITGQSLQIVVNAHGQNTLDARGPGDPSAFNTLWTVVNEGKNQVHLHNYHNYITVNGGVTLIKQCPPGTVLGLDTKFQLSQVQKQFVTLESLKEKNYHVGFLASGELKPALATTKEIDSHLGVRLVSSGVPVPAK